jgi:hypothetical protein
MLKHPQELGFTLGLKLLIDKPASIKHTPDALIRDVVYVALFADDKTLEKSTALKVGQTKGNVLSRWRGIARLFTRCNLRENEIQDRKKLQEFARGKEVAVWIKPAGKTSLVRRVLHITSFPPEARRRNFWTSITSPSSALH